MPADVTAFLGGPPRSANMTSYNDLFVYHTGYITYMIVIEAGNESQLL
jgi:hypothetical protein